MEYMPSGELFSEQRDWWSTPYKFNGKELDSETNLYYYGARYYTAMENIWLSVDPLSDKYPSMSAYMYCAGNPVILVDPDGLEPVLFGILQRTGEAKYGRSRLGESTTVGQYNVIPIYSSDNKTLIAYNAGRYLPNGEYRTEYQMAPDDLEGFTKNVSTYTAGANLVYCAGEPDWNLMMMTNYGMQGDYANALSSLGQSWANAFKDPGFWASVAFSFGMTALNLSNANVSNIITNAEKGTGNFGVGSGSVADAYVAGKKWVGDGYRVSSNGKAWVSANGSRQFRIANKPRLGKVQANFESRNGNSGRWTNNGHMDVK
jgi:RHS repeat-associated protein